MFDHVWQPLSCCFPVRCSACTPEAAGTPPPTTRSTAIAAAPADGTVPAGRWRAVLIAGDNNSPAFDNGVQSLREKLVAHGVTNISVYSSNAAAHGAERSSRALPTWRRHCAPAAATPVSCSSPATARRRGFVLKTDRRLFDPGSLDRVLSAGCGSVPTVVVRVGLS